MNTSRYFKHKTQFGDNTDYVEITHDGVGIVHFKGGGHVIVPDLDIAFAIQAVNDVHPYGWKEVFDIQK